MTPVSQELEPPKNPGRFSQRVGGKSIETDRRREHAQGRHHHQGYGEPSTQALEQTQAQHHGQIRSKGYEQRRAAREADGEQRKAAQREDDGEPGPEGHPEYET
jgi:hypothetical protein